MAKQRHQQEVQSSSKATMVGMAVAGLLVAGLVVWALTRTVQTPPASTATFPVTTETATSTFPTPPVTGSNPALPPVQISNTAQTSTITPPDPATDETATVKRISVTDLRSRLDTKAVTIIDVRDKTSFIASHIPGALHMPMATVESQVSFLPKDKPIVTYCTWPNEESSARAALILQKYGINDVAALEGGYDAWRTIGGPTAQGDPPALQ